MKKSRGLIIINSPQNDKYHKFDTDESVDLNQFKAGEGYYIQEAGESYYGQSSSSYNTDAELVALNAALVCSLHIDSKVICILSDSALEAIIKKEF